MQSDGQWQLLPGKGKNVMITNLQHVLSDVVTVETASKETARQDEDEESMEEEEDLSLIHISEPTRRA